MNSPPIMLSPIFLPSIALDSLSLPMIKKPINKRIYTYIGWRAMFRTDHAPRPNHIPTLTHRSLPQPQPPSWKHPDQISYVSFLPAYPIATLANHSSVRTRAAVGAWDEHHSRLAWAFAHIWISFSFLGILSSARSNFSRKVCVSQEMGRSRRFIEMPSFESFWAIGRDVIFFVSAK